MSIHNMEFYKQQRRAHWLARLFAWAGVVLLGSLLMFCACVFLMQCDMVTAALDVAVCIICAWGLWGFVFLKTRH